MPNLGGREGGDSTNTIENTYNIFLVLSATFTFIITAEIIKQKKNIFLKYKLIVII